MWEHYGSTSTPTVWQLAVESVHNASIPPDIHLSEIVAPTNLAPEALAYAAEVTPTSRAPQTSLGTGRFILLHDPHGNDAWQGSLRIVCFAKATLETDLGLDPFLADVTWSWLIDALENGNAEYAHASGTVTKTINTGYGELAGGGEGMELEVRASWSPHGTAIGTHVEAWMLFLRQLAGIPPLPDGISALDTLRRTLHHDVRDE